MESVFADLDETDRADFLRRGRRRSFAAGDKVFWQGDPGGAVHLVRKGSFVASVSTPMAHTMIMSVYRTGDLFGELSLFTPDNRRSATVVALEPGETTAVEREAFEEWRAARPHVDRGLVQALARRIHNLTDQMMEAVYLPVDARLARRLLVLHDVLGRPSPDGWIRIRQEELAAFCGAGRPAVNRALAELVDRGVVEVGRGRLRVRDEALLRRAAQLPAR